MKTRLLKFRLYLIIIILSFLIAIPHNIIIIKASPHTVNTLTDTNDGTCDTTHCSLREAIAVAGSGAVIDFASGLTGSIVLGSELVIDKSLTINGPGATVITVSGNNAVRIFSVVSGVSLTFSGLTLANGWDSIWGGAILNEGGTLSISNAVIRDNSANNGGGGIVNNVGSVAVVSDTLFQNNTATNGSGASIYSNFATFTLLRSTVQGSVANGSGGGGGGFVSSGGNTTIANSTFQGNVANTGTGGGLFASGGTVTITNSTFDGNRATYPAPDAGGAIFASGSDVIVKNTILANSTSGGNCNVAITNAGNNLQYPGTTCGASIPSANPLLAPLANNGGSTPTMALQAGSPAIDAGDNTACANAPVNNVDQRGMPRPTDGEGDGNAACDIGAFELESGIAPTVTPTSTPSIPTNTPTPQFASTVNTLTDTNDGTCDTTHCSLREAIAAAGSGAVIDFASGLTGSIVLGSELVIDKSLTINGPGATVITVSGNNAVRIFSVVSGVSLTFSGLTLANGWDSIWGGAILNEGGTLSISNAVIRDNSANNGGGGIVNNVGSVAVVSDTLFQNNTATVGSGGSIYSNFATFTLLRSTVQGSVANGSGGGGGGFVSSGGNTTIANSTFQGNVANAGHGGGLFASGGTVTITNSTFDGNRATNPIPDAGGAIFASGSDVIVKNTILANSTSGGNCNVAITNAGNNLQYPGTTCGASIPSANPLLAPLANNGGSTPTMALQAGSPAIDAGNNAVCASDPVNNVDQRGMPRPTDGDGDGNAACDIGAFEADTLIVPTNTPTPTINDLHAKVNVCVTDQGLNSALHATLNAENFQAFINQVEAQSGNAIDEQCANEMIALATYLMNNP